MEHDTINVLLEQLVKAIPVAKFKAAKKVTPKKDATPVTFRSLKSAKASKDGDWLAPVDVESLRISNAIASCTRYADKGFSLRWIKEDLKDITLKSSYGDLTAAEHIGLIRMKHSSLVIKITMIKLEKQVDNLCANFTSYVTDHDRDELIESNSGKLNSMNDRFRARAVGMSKPKGEKGSPKPGLELTM